MSSGSEPECTGMCGAGRAAAIRAPAATSSRKRFFQLVLKAFSLDSLTGSMPTAPVEANRKPQLGRELPSSSGGGMGDVDNLLS